MIQSFSQKAKSIYVQGVLSGKAEYYAYILVVTPNIIIPTMIEIDERALSKRCVFDILIHIPTLI